MIKQVSDDEIIKRIALKMVPLIGDAIAKNLISYFGSASAIFKEKKAKLLKVPGIGESIADNLISFKNFSRAEKELNFIHKHKIQTYFYADDNYPKRLKLLSDAPFIFYYRGNADLDHQKIISIVGTREATEYGRNFCNKLIEELVPHEVLVISGLAYGIDIAAHKAALVNNLPTIAVLAHGLDTIYPSMHKSIAAKMIRHGGVLSEYISDTNPDRENFPDRNRIVAGMSDAIIVVEAAIKGGALITAEYGNSYNKDVFALPGRNNDEYSAGCNKLIKTHKAALIENTEDLIYMMGWEQEKIPKVKKQRALLLNLTPLESGLLEKLNEKERTHIDEIAQACQVSGSELALVLLNLEFNSIIKSLPGNFYMRL
jgi:DNA processing protein